MAETSQPKSSTAPPINPSPKVRFMAMGPVMSKYKTILDMPEFQVALDHALLHYQHMLTNTGLGDIQTAAAVGLKIQGAVEFIGYLKTISETVHEPRRAETSQLKY